MKIDKLIPMTDFVLNFSKTNHDSDEFENTITDYAEFLKQPLKLEMFVPCDEDGNVLEEPYFDGENDHYYSVKKDKFETVKEKVLFEWFEIRSEKRNKYIFIEGYEIKLPIGNLKMTIEDLANDWYHILLTESALNQIYK